MTTGHALFSFFSRGLESLSCERSASGFGLRGAAGGAGTGGGDGDPGPLRVPEGGHHQAAGDEGGETGGDGGRGGWRQGGLEMGAGSLVSQTKHSRGGGGGGGGGGT